MWEEKAKQKDGKIKQEDKNQQIKTWGDINMERLKCGEIKM